MTRKTRDRVLLLLATLVLWKSLTLLLTLDVQLFPPPETVAKLLLEDRTVFLESLVSSFVLLLAGGILAVVTAIPLGLLVGWQRRLYDVLEPVMNILGPVPPIVYIPYAIVLLPTFRSASIFIIFIGAFWPLFLNTVIGVRGVERGLLHSASTLGVGKGTMLWRILLPGAMPQILAGGTISLVMSFILLTAAEMIGATSGLGWYVKNFADFADYPRVVAGIVVIGLVVSALMVLYNGLAAYLLRWRPVRRD